MAEQILPEMQDISRQRDLAKLLLQKGMADNMGGQVVSGRYVGASPLQGIANLYSAYQGKKLAEESDAKQAELAEKLRRVQATEAQDILSALQGSPEKTVYGAGMEGPTMNVTPAVPGSQQAALAKALAGRSPFSQTMAAKLMEQQFKEPKWEKVEKYDAKTGNTYTGMVNVNSPNPESTFREIAVSKPAMSAKDIAELRDKGIAVGGGMPTGGVSFGGVSTGGGQLVGNQSPTQVVGSQSMPSSYTYNPSLSPAQNRELQGKFVAEQQKNIKNAKESFDVIKEAVDVFNTGAPSSGMLKSIKTGVAEAFDIPTEAADADAKLTILGEKLTAQVPRFEGPQSDKDTASYRAAAGDLGNSNKTINTRLSALKQLIELNKKYYPQGDWDKLDLAGPVRTKQTFLKGSETMSPEKFKQGLKGPDQEAFDWARRNPNDPRATEIKKRLGFQ
jgi:hypothetical protein